jgi:hypothetical protein
MCDENKEETKRKKRYKKDVVLMCCDGWDYIIYALGLLLWIGYKVCIGLSPYQYKKLFGL